MKIKHFVFFSLFGLCNSLFSQNDNQENIPYEWNFNKYRFGGYAEMLYQHMDYGPNRYTDPNGAPSDNRSYISIPRAIFALDYKFRDDIILGTEIEFEYGGTGAAMELEYAEAGEYEMEIEKAGEVVLEQFHITKRFKNWLNVRAGHMIVPVGLTNAHHEPVFFFGTTRPEGETTIIPSTWHETGISVLGYLPKFRYEVMMVNGLDPNGFSTANWVGSGKQGLFEQSIMTNPAFAARVEYSGVKGLRIGSSGYYAHKTSGNSTKPHFMSDVKGQVKIVSADFQYAGYGAVARGNIVYGTLSDSKDISKINTSFRKAGYPGTPVSKAAMTYALEVGYDVFSLFDKKQKLVPFVRYDYYNTAQDLEEGTAQQPRYKRDLFTFGVNYSLLPNLVIKADYSHRRIDAGNYNSENTIGLAIAYTGWFISK